VQWRLLDDNIDQMCRFNDFMATHPKGHVLQTWQWGSLKGAGTWQPLRLVVEEGGEIIAAVSLLKRQLPFRMGSLFYVPRGPVLDIEREDVWNLLLEGIAALAKTYQAVFLKIDPDIKDGDPLWSKRLKQAGFHCAEKGEGFEGIQPRHVFRLDISPDEETLLANLQQKTRYNLRLAEKKGVEVVVAGRDSLADFYKLLCETAERDKFLIRPYKYYENFYDFLVPAGLAELFLVYYEGKAIAGALAFRLGEKAWYIYGASANQYRNVMPNYLMQWRMIQWAKSHGCTMYDFRGVPGDVGPEHPLYGLVKFKKGFGGEYISFIGEYDLVYRPANYRFYHWLEPRYQKAVRHFIRAKKKIKGGR